MPLGQVVEVVQHLLAREGRLRAASYVPEVPDLPAVETGGGGADR